MDSCCNDCGGRVAFGGAWEDVDMRNFEKRSDSVGCWQMCTRLRRDVAFG